MTIKKMIGKATIGISALIVIGFVFSLGVHTTQAAGGIISISPDPGPGLRLPVCGNGVKEAGEQCDTFDMGDQTCTNNGWGPGLLACNDDCTVITSECARIPSSGPTQPASTGGGGGGGSFVALAIHNEQASAITQSTATITWSTNKPSETKVLYDTVSHDGTAGAPNYGYANATLNDVTWVMSHTMSLTNLQPGTTYFWRAYSFENNGAALGDEMSFTTVAAETTPTSTPATEPTNEPATPATPTSTPPATVAETPTSSPTATPASKPVVTHTKSAAGTQNDTPKVLGVSTTTDSVVSPTTPTDQQVSTTPSSTTPTTSGIGWGKALALVLILIGVILYIILSNRSKGGSVTPTPPADTTEPTKPDSQK